MHLLIVEDDQMLGNAMLAGLKRTHAVDWFTHGEDALLWLETQSADAVILDVKLPDTTGFEIVRTLRRARNTTPVLILTALDAVSHRIEGLDCGADDYLTKPFDLGELEARLRALSRRNQGCAASVLSVEDITLDPASRTVRKAHELVPVSGREFDILQILFENVNRLVRRDQIEFKLYSADGHVESNAVEVHISSLRRKLGRDLIETRRGFGYMIAG